MTLTLSNCVERINQALDYPALEYTDISHYFDQAISELNSTLRIGLRPITQLLAESKFVLNGMSNVVALDKYPTSGIPCCNEDSSGNIIGVDGTPLTGTYYYDVNRQLYGVKMFDKWNYYSTLYAVYNDDDFKTNILTAAYYNDTLVMWTVYEYDTTDALDLTDYLPVDVIILFIIPYVCFKFTVRDGGDGQLFREEFIQGFQQIQTSYDIPNTVNLATVAGKKAYTEDVKTHIDNLNVVVPIRAIYDTMKIGNAIMPEYGGFYESGGWGV